MFVKVSCIFGEQKRVLLAVKKKDKQHATYKKKISVNILFLSLEPTWSGLSNMTIEPFEAKKGSIVRGQIWDEIANNLNSLQHPQFSDEAIC